MLLLHDRRAALAIAAAATTSEPARDDALRDESEPNDAETDTRHPASRGVASTVHRIPWHRDPTFSLGPLADRVAGLAP